MWQRLRVQDRCVCIRRQPQAARSAGRRQDEPRDVVQQTESLRRGTIVSTGSKLVARLHCRTSNRGLKLFVTIVAACCDL